MWPRRSSWNRADLLEQVGISNTGEYLIRQAAQAGYTIEIVDPESGRIPQTAEGSHNSEYRGILIDSSLSLDQATCTFSHELGHSSQHLNGACLPPEACTQDQFIDQTIANEKDAETIANKVAYELHQRGILGPRKSQENGTYAAQAKAFGQAKDAGLSDEIAARISEPLWAESRTQPYYENWAKSNWQHTNQNTQIHPDMNDAERQGMLSEGIAAMPPPPPPAPEPATSPSVGMRA